MNATLRTPKMTREQFLDWVERQEAPYEFDGFEPVPMTGGNRNHSRICRNLLFSLQSRLRDSEWELLGEAGIATIGNAVRYPDALLTRTQGPGTDRLMPAPVVVLEVISPTSGRMNRIVKPREYRAVPSIRRYVILGNQGADLTVYWRTEAGGDWTADTLSSHETLKLPEIGVEIPVDEFYVGVPPEELSGA